MSMRQITLDGRIGKDAKVMTTKGGKNYIRFSLANDSFVNGANKTEWFDISCFDPYIVENRSKYMTKGRYAIVQGVWNSEVMVKDGKVYLNHYVSANNIELPSFGKKEESNEVTVSTYTGGTKSEHVVEQVSTNTPAKPAAAPVAPQPQAVAAQPQASTIQSAPVGWGSSDEDLPF